MRSEDSSERSPEKASQIAARRLLDKAIAAYGGENGLEKLKKCRVKYRATVNWPPFVEEAGANTIVMEDCFLFPDKQRRTVTDVTSGAERMLFVVHGRRVWIREPGKPIKLTESPPTAMAFTRFPSVISMLDQLISVRDSGAVIAVTPPEIFDGHLVVGLTRYADGQPASTSYFDTSTNLCVRIINHQMPDLRDPPHSLHDVSVAECCLSEHKTFDGVTLPTRTVTSQGGQTLFEYELLEIEFPAEFDPALFEKPKERQP